MQTKVIVELVIEHDENGEPFGVVDRVLDYGVFQDTINDGTEGATYKVTSAICRGEVDETKPIEWVCADCGSANVECAMWVNPNTEEVSGDFGTFNADYSTYCNDCDEHRTLVKPEQYAESQTVYRVEGRDDSCGEGWSWMSVAGTEADATYDTEAEAVLAMHNLAVSTGWSRDNLRVIKVAP
jgi:hypothetical protein